MKGLILRASFTDLTEILDRAHDLYPRLGGTWQAGEKRYVWKSGATIEFNFCDTIKDAKKKYRGRQFTYIGYDEIGELAEERTWLFLLTRIRSTDPKAVLMARGSANPGGEGHAWVKARFVVPTHYGAQLYLDDSTRTPEAPEGLTRAFIPGKLEDNPLIAAEYLSKILLQDPVTQRQLLGDWDAAVGMAFAELLRESMVIPRLEVIPRGWEIWAGHDWGFAHWAVTVLFGKDHRGQVYVIDTVWSRRLQAPQICEEIWERFPVERISAVYSGGDLFAEHKARGEEGVSLSEKYLEAGIPVVPAVRSKRNRYQYARDALSWMGRGPGGGNILPRVLFCDTPGNNRLFEQLQGMTTDPDDPEVIAKVDANPTDGKGGDDGCDAFLAGLATKRPIPTDPVLDQLVSAFSPAALAFEADKSRRVQTAAQILQLPALQMGGEVE